MPIDIFALDDSASFDDGEFDVVNENFVPVINQLFPTGPIWTWRPGGVMEGLIRALSYEPSRVEQRALQLLSEMDPRTTEELIDDWESYLGLPGQNLNPPTDLEDRQEAVHAKFTSRSVGNEPFFLELADSLGYPSAEIRREGRPFRCGSSCGDSLRGYRGYWLDTWTLIANLSTANDETLQLFVNHYKQDQEIVLFEFP